MLGQVWNSCKIVLAVLIAVAVTLTTACYQPQPAAGELRLLDPNEPSTLDPHRVIDASSAYWVVEIFGGLVTIDKNLKIAADLAESWDVSTDGTEYIFHLRRNARFHDGRKVTANDVKYSFERATDPDILESPAEIFLGDIVGVNDKLHRRANELSGVQVIDNYTLRVTISCRNSSFLWKLAYPTAFVVDAQQIEAKPENWTDQPNGTGPFRLIKCGPGQIVLERNPYYHLQCACVQRVVADLEKDLVNASAPYQNNEVDVAYLRTEIAKLERQLDSELSKELLSVPELATFSIAFNTTVPPFDDGKVRQALAMAVDKKGVVEHLFGDTMPVAEGILPPEMPSFNPELKGLSYDPEKARQLLKKSKYGESFPPVTLTVSSYLSVNELGSIVNGFTYLPAAPRPTTLSLMLADMWMQNIGIEVDILPLNPTDFRYTIKKDTPQMFLYGWRADFPDPHEFLEATFHTEGSLNYSGYSNCTVDRLLDKARSEMDASEQIRLYRNVEEILTRDVPWFPLYYLRSHLLVKPWVKDWPLTPPGIPKLRHVTIER